MAARFPPTEKMSSSKTVIALIILPSLLFSSPVSSALVNRTIDDEYGDSVTGVKPTYGPDDSYWHQGSTCSACHITPFIDKTQSFDGTWHDGTYSPGGPDLTISFSFTGTAVYVFNIIPNTLNFTDTLADVTFTVDGAHGDEYVHTPDSTSTFLYRQLVYKSTGLANQEHSVIMSSTGTKSSLILFDYVVYTAEQSITSSGMSTSSTSSASSSATSTPSSSHSTPVAAIAGGVVGGIAFLAILAVVGFIFRRRRNPKQSRPTSAHLETKPFVEDSDMAAYGTGSAYAGGLAYGGASGNGGSNDGTSPHHALQTPDTPAIPLLLANTGPSVMPHPRSPDFKVPLTDRTRTRKCQCQSHALPLILLTLSSCNA